MERVFNNAAGFTAKDDDLPARLKTEPAKTGPAKGLVSGIDKMVAEYYQLRGLEKAGVPTRNPEASGALDPISGTPKVPSGLPWRFCFPSLNSALPLATRLRFMKSCLFISKSPLMKHVIHRTHPGGCGRRRRHCAQ